jgi:hypothetical protein
MKTNTNRHGWFSRPGALNTELLGSKAIRIPFGFRGMDHDTIEIATGPSQIVGQVRVLKRKAQTAPRANTTGNASSPNVWRTYASALSPEQQRAVDLIVGAKPLNRIP